MGLNEGIKENESKNLISAVNDLRLPEIGLKAWEIVFLYSDGYICCY